MQFRFLPLEIFTLFPLQISDVNLIYSKCASIEHLSNKNCGNEKTLYYVTKPDVETPGFAKRL